MPLYADITGDDDVKRGKTRAEAYHAYLEAISSFLSAHHAGHIHFTYEHVFSYDLGCLPQLRRSDGRFVLPKHEDWLADEISLSSSGNVVHEVHFSSGCVWKIEARRVSYLYVPIPGKQLQV